MRRTKLTDMISFDCSQGKPRVLIVGEIQHPDIAELLDAENVWLLKGLKSVETYGYGESPDRFDNWIPGDDRDRRIIFNAYVEDKKRRDYGFDMVVLDLRNWLNVNGSFCRPDDPWLDAVGYLKEGGIAIVVGEPYSHRQVLGSYPYRLEGFHFFPEVPEYSHHIPQLHFMIGLRKSTWSPNHAGKFLLECYLDQYDPRTQKELFIRKNSPAPASLLEPVGLPHVVKCEPQDPPIIMPRRLDKNFLEQKLSDSPGPFEIIRKHLFSRGIDRTVRIPLRPSIGNLAKLATLADGVVKDDAGNFWVVKGVPETIHVEVESTDEEEKTSRDLKRLNLYAVQVTGDNRGNMIETQLG